MRASRRENQHCDHSDAERWQPAVTGNGNDADGGAYRLCLHTKIGRSGRRPGLAIYTSETDAFGFFLFSEFCVQKESNVRSENVVDCGPLKIVLC